jgi:uncharacterized RDD family membrane protein YckC
VLGATGAKVRRGEEDRDGANPLHRLGAQLLDTVFLMPVGVLVYFGFMSFAGAADLDAYTASLVVGIANGAISLFYYTFCIGVWGQTFGKMVTKVKVVSLDGRPVGFFSSFVRVIVASVLFPGAILALADEKRQALHDKVVNTRVVDATRWN